MDRMTTPRQRRFLIAVTAWTVGAIGLLSTLGRLTAEHVFVAGFVGLVLVTAFTAPVYAVVDWRERLRWPLVVGALVFLAFVGLRTVEKFLGTL